MIVAPGWHLNMPMADYLALEAMSASGIEAFRRSPLHFFDQQLTPKNETPAMREGTALHYALLEPHLFEGRYLSLGQCEATKKDRERCTSRASVVRDGPGGTRFQFCGTHDPYRGDPMPAGLEVMPADALERIDRMRRSVLAHPDAREFFEGRGASELVGVWKDPDTGVLCKLRLDRQIDKADYIHADLKSTADASRDGFRRIAGRLGYHRKAAWYRRGLAALGKPATASVLIAVESVRPHACQTFILDEAQLARVGRLIDSYLVQYAECLTTGDWPGYETGLRQLEIAPWDMPPVERGEGPEWDASETWDDVVDDGEGVGF